MGGEIKARPALAQCGGIGPEVDEEITKGPPLLLGKRGRRHRKIPAVEVMG